MYHASSLDEKNSSNSSNHSTAGRYARHACHATTMEHAILRKVLGHPAGKMPGAGKWCHVKPVALVSWQCLMKEEFVTE